MKYRVIISVQLAYNFDVKNEEEAIIEVKNIELPSGYVEDSFKLIKVEKEIK